MRRRIAIIDYKKCRPSECNYLCQRVCPVVRMGKEAVYVEESQVHISEELCTGCGICVHKCPFNAISIINLELDLENPVHQYGANRFRLFRLPLIREGQTVGIIGKNGIGKSTIVKILAGLLIPNLGKYNEKGNYEDIINFYKGKELQKVFEKIKDKKFKVSYKPQNVEILSNLYDAKVIDLLKKIDEKQMLNKVVLDLELNTILDRNIKQLSGGELQKVALAAAMLKKADVYFYDEPTSFLDVKQRFKVAQILSESKDTKMLVEHDLAILDYVSDYLHLIFGKPHAYGVVSNIKSTSLAINEFLGGFIKDENLRFRNYELNFIYTEEKNISKQDLFLSYPSLKKTFKSFEMDSEPGELFVGDVIGILGENGIGKTTFIKLLANVEIPDNTKLDFNMKIAYKPQSLMLIENKDLTVREYLKNTNQEILKTELWGKLSLERISNYKLGDLNGGDLQKVFVAKALAEDADIYLLDEPSAFLDVEERLNVAKAIRNIILKRKKVVFVVDHDILFIDYISDKIMVFEGTPGIKGFASKPLNKKEGMNKFLKMIDITYRKDPQTKRPRINKKGSVKDNEQKSTGNYYTQ